MLTPTQLQRYVARLGVSPRSSLAELQLAHLYALPFENLDITFKRPIVLSHEAILAKLLDEHRGGFCYELNYGFYCLLLSLGFEATLIQARVFNPSGTPGTDFDHLLLKVKEGSKTLLADVGFGDSFLAPLTLATGEQQDRAGVFTLTAQQGKWLMQREGKAELLIDPTPRQLQAFQAMADWHQSAEASPFTRKSICSKATATGRISLSDNTLLVTKDKTRQQWPINNEGQYRQLLAEHFGITLPFADIAQWLAKWH
ncbi:arylamine N-acetyltransferase family protein [Gallaecimonas pentaromativorans]|uniref:N-hydroxyarylamine O-acetyltransferase n=1 Tax=Gallaecimonas pentaromativorans TaxID=584787 RepID=A0A3N1PKP2_9GAMM|nr:arylamine N-acetyltransferase [Gallaecimonas pentaromativorans]ROQ28689.1 N-hydroxyarylamine O-acetyltransferase [Gallaecimonas pentaromativorans]